MASKMAVITVHVKMYAVLDAKIAELWVECAADQQFAVVLSAWNERYKAGGDRPVVGGALAVVLHQLVVAVPRNLRRWPTPT